MKEKFDIILHHREHTSIKYYKGTYLKKFSLVSIDTDNMFNLSKNNSVTDITIPFFYLYDFSKYVFGIFGVYHVHLNAWVFNGNSHYVSTTLPDIENLVIKYEIVDPITKYTKPVPYLHIKINENIRASIPNTIYNFKIVIRSVNMLPTMLDQ